jgi:hypothetical protein
MEPSLDALDEAMHNLVRALVASEQMIPACGEDQREFDSDSNKSQRYDVIWHRSLLEVCTVASNMGGNSICARMSSLAA